MTIKTARCLLKWVIPIGLILWFPFRFYWEIAHYYTHYDNQLMGCILGVVGLVVCAAGIFWALYNDERAPVVLYGLAAISCVFFCYWITRIPYCTECDGLRRSDLGFMLRPFADRFGVLGDD